MTIFLLNVQHEMPPLLKVSTFAPCYQMSQWSSKKTHFNLRISSRTFLWFCVSINLGSGSLLDGAGCPPECLANVRGLINIKLSEEERGSQLHLPLDARTHIDTDWWPGCLPCGGAVVAIEVSNATWRQCKLTLVPYLHRRNTCCYDDNLSCFVSISFVLPICLLFLCITVHQCQHFAPREVSKTQGLATSFTNPCFLIVARDLLCFVRVCSCVTKTGRCRRKKFSHWETLTFPLRLPSNRAFAFANFWFIQIYPSADIHLWIYRALTGKRGMKILWQHSQLQSDGGR